MLYEEYQKKVQQHLARVRKFLKITAMILMMIAALSAGLFAFEYARGSFTSALSCSDILYGEAVSPSAQAFLSSVCYEFRSENSDWTPGFPQAAGCYTLRGKTENRLGVVRYSNEVPITVFQRDLSVQPKPLSVEFGEKLILTSRLLQADGLADGDFIDSFRLSLDTSILGQQSVHVTDLRIKRQGGLDVTDSYRLTCQPEQATVAKRLLVLQSPPASKEYDRSPLICPQVSVSQGSLGYGHRYEVEFSGSQTEPGTSENLFTCKIFDAMDNDVTDCYDLQLHFGKLLVTQRSLRIQTNSAEKVYDGTPFSDLSYEILIGNLLSGHSLSVHFLAKQYTASSFENTATFTVTDDNGKDVTALYHFLPKFGTLTIKKRPLYITTGSASKVYDGTKLYCKEYSLTSGSLADGQRLILYAYSDITQVGKIPNDLIFQIWTQKSNYNVTINYEFILTPGTLEVLPNGSTGGTTGGGNSGGITGGGNSGGTTGGGNSGGTSSGGTSSGGNSGGITGGISGGGALNGNNGATDGSSNPTDFGKHAPLPTNPSTPSSQIAFQIYASESKAYYLKGKSYGTYNGQLFKEATPYFSQTYPYQNNSYRMQPGISLREAGSPTSKLSILYRQKDFGTALLPYHLVEISGDPHLFTVTDTYATHVNKMLSEFSTLYVADSDEVLRSGAYKQWNDPEEFQYRNHVYQAYLQLPSDTKAAVLDFLNEKGVTADMGIEKIAEFVRSCGVYNTQYQEIPQDCQDIALYFLTVSKEGICEHFAAAGTVIFRALGFPARYVAGYYVKTVANTWIDVPVGNAHAWVEVYVDGFGWLPVDVTGEGISADNQPPTADLRPKVTIGTYSGSREFSGQAVTMQDFYFIENNLAPNHGVYFQSIPMLRPGTYGNIPDQLYIYDRVTGENVTHQYNLTLIPGTVEILPRKITISTASAHKKYDGQPLSCQEYTLLSGTLPDHFVLTVEMPASITEKGTISNVPAKVTVTCLLADYTYDATDCFDIQYGTIGSLTIF